MNRQLTGHEAALDARARRIDLAHQPDFDVGAVTVQPSLRKLTGPAGEAMLEPKVMQVLVALAQPIGTILSRDDLIERCWDGRIVGDTSINRVISLLRSGLKDVAGDAVRVENVPKVGYRLMALVVAACPVEAPVDDNAGAPPAAPSSLEVSPDRAKTPRALPLRVLGGAALAALVLLAAFLWLQPAADEPVPQLRIAMLPLEAAEGVDPLYASGLESELRAQFARLGALEVTASDSARQLVAEGLGGQEIGKRLGVDFVWTGAFRSEAGKVVLSARLIDVAGAQQAWQQNLSSAPDDAQNIPLRTARAMAETLGRSTDELLPRTPVSASGYRLYLTASGLLKSRGAEQRVAARSILEQVTLENPKFADGWAGLAKALFLYPELDPEAREALRATALEHAQFALTLDPASVDALKVVGMLAKEPAQRLEHLARATQLDPGDAEAWFWYAITQDQFMHIAHDPLESVRRMVAVDPLWPASWSASDLAARFGRIDEAREIENRILSAAVTNSQKYLAEARLARMEGDLSRFVELARKADTTSTEAERLWGNQLQMRMIRRLLGFPVPDDPRLRDQGTAALMQAIERGTLPSVSEFAAAGAADAQFWDKERLAGAALPLFLTPGREADLVRFYDARFASHEDYIAFAEERGEAHAMIPAVSPYLGAALQKVGRSEEAAAHFASAERELARWKEADTVWITPLLHELDLAAAKGEDERAIAIVQRLPEFGWPWMMAQINPTVIGLLDANPLHARTRELPEVRAVLGPIRSRLAKERAQVLEAGGI